MAEYFNMGGYGAYVWSSYGIVAVSLIYLGVKAHWQAKKLKQELKDNKF